MIVLDISAAITRALPSQTTPASEAFFARDPTPGLVAPPIFEAEASNALLRAARQGRFEPERVEAAIRDLMMTVALRIGGTASEVRALAWAEHISFFDACYLDLAMREGAPLASRDAALLAAAGRRGVAVEDLR